MEPQDGEGPPERPKKLDLSNHTLAVFEGLQVIGNNALKLTWILNGGAAIALLAFLGGLAEKGFVLTPFLWPMKMFGAGVVLGAVAHILAYIMQLQLFNEEMGRSVGYRSVTHKALLRTAIGLVFCSVVLFAFGVNGSAESFNALTRASPSVQ